MGSKNRESHKRGEIETQQGKRKRGIGDKEKSRESGEVSVAAAHLKRRGTDGRRKSER